MTDVELQAAVAAGIVAAQAEIQVRDDIRGLIAGFRTQITTLIANGDVVAPVGADTTPDKETFADLFLREDRTLVADPALQALYRGKMIDATGSIHTHFAADVANNRNAISDAITNKKTALIADCKVFAGTSTKLDPIDIVNDYHTSKAAKPVEQAVITANRADFETGVIDVKKAALVTEFKTFATTSPRGDPALMVEDFFAFKGLSIVPPIHPLTVDRVPFLAVANEARKTALLADCKSFAERDASPGVAHRRRDDAVNDFITSKAASPAEQAIITANRAEFEKQSNEGIYEKHNLLKAEPIAAKVEAMAEKVKESRETIIKILTKLGGTRPADKNQGKIWDTLKFYDTTLALREPDINRYKAHIEMIKNWQEGTMTDTPTEFILALTGSSVHAIPAAEMGAVVTRFVDQINRVPNAKDVDWRAIGGSDDEIRAKKKRVAEDICKDDITSVCIAEELENIESYMSDLEGEMAMLQIPEICEESENFLKAMDDAALKDMDKETVSTTLYQKFHALNEGLGIAWVTPYQLYLGWKKYWDVRKSTRDERNRRAGSKVAKVIGDTIGAFTRTKFDADVSQALKASADGEDNKVKSEFIEVLKSGPSSFQDLFKLGGIYEHNQHDPNLNRAVLEYAASRGWLYNMDYASGTVMGRPLIPGTNLPAGEDIKNYMDQIRDTNTSGMNTEKKRGSDIVDRESDFNKIFAEFKDQLDQHNYMAAVGIIERSIGKGKRPDSITLFATTLVRHIRSTGTAWKYVNNNVIEALKGIGYSYPLFTTAMLSYDLPRIIHREQRGEANAMEGSTFTATLARLEQDIRAQNRNIDDDELDELVAKALSGQTITGDKKKKEWAQAISIFDDQYKAYRNEISANARPNSMTYDKMQDFLKGSELLLTGPDVFNKIFKITSTVDFDDKTLAQPFAGDIMERYDTLLDLYRAGKIPKKTVENFQKKFQTLFESYFANTPRATEAAQFDFTTTKKGGGDERVFEGMYLRGLLAKSTLDDKAAKGNNLARTILAKCPGGPTKMP